MTEAHTPKGFLSLFLKHGGMALILPLGLGILLAAISVYTGKQADEFEQQGVVAIAEVVGTTLSKQRSIRVGDPDYEVPTVTLRFDAGKTPITTSAEISDELYETLSAGDSVSIRYLPADPKTIEVQAGETRQATLISGLLSLVFLVLWAVFVVRSAKFARHAIQLRDAGVRRLVKVAEHKSPLMTNDRNPETRIVWQDSYGREAHSLTLPETLAQKFPVGGEIAIYEPHEGGSTSVWEGDVGARSNLQEPKS